MEFHAFLRAPRSIMPSTSMCLRAAQRPLISLYPIITRPAYRSLTTTRPTLAAPPPRRAPAPSAPTTTTSDKDKDLSASLDSLLGRSVLDTPRRAPPSSTSSADFANAFGRSVFGTRSSAAASTRSLDFNRMQMPAGTPPTSDLSNLPPPPLPNAVPATPPRFNASTGRSIELDPARGRDLIRGLGMLNSLVARNGVKRDVMSQRFHERAGLKRKRLRGERWRKRFKVGFNHLVTRVGDLTRKGW